MSRAQRRERRSVPRAREAAVREQNRRYDELTVAIMRRALASDSNCVDADAHRGGLLQHMVALAPEGTHHYGELIGAGLHVSRPDDWLAGRSPLSTEGFIADLGTSWFFLAHPP
jgi:hypothetical protein